MTRAVLSSAAVGHLEAFHQRIVPAGRIQTAEDVGKFVALLTRDHWLNGSVIDATGGAPLTLMDHAFNGGPRAPS